MKNINQFNLIPSLVIIGSCLAFSPLATARPVSKFHGSLIVTVDGAIMPMGGAKLGTSSMLMLPPNAEFVTVASPDFRAVGLDYGDAVSFSTTMLTPGTQEMLMFPDAPDLMVMTDRATFTSVRKGTGLHVEAQATIMDMADPNYGTSNAVLIGEFYTFEDGSVRGIFTLSASPGDVLSKPNSF
jgi:hypothetical protein